VDNASKPAGEGRRIPEPLQLEIRELDCDLDRPIAPATWLTFSEQQLRSVTHGPICHDEVGLAEARTRLAWSPRDLWLYLLASGLNRISQEEHLMGRAGSVGGELGAAILGSRLVRDIMRLCFLMERIYAPYPKWFGTAFKELACADALLPALQAAVTAAAWQKRERHLAIAYEHIDDPEVRRIATRSLIGSVDQFSDSTDLIATSSWRPALKALYQ